MKILVSDEDFLSTIEVLATEITQAKFGEDMYIGDLHCEVWSETITEEAYDYYMSKLDEYEELLNNQLNIYNEQRL